MEKQANELFISPATLWELGIKESLGKLKIKGGVEALHEEWLVSGVAESLPMRWVEIQRVMILPWIHRDPFDRLLVAQALVNNLRIVTDDCNILRCRGVKVYW